MRKITKLAVAAFDANKNFQLDNTRVEVKHYGETHSTPLVRVRLYLHDNLIAVKAFFEGEEDKAEFCITTADWNTSTTKERLNGLNGVSVYHKKKQMYLNGKAWDGSLVDVNKWNAEMEETCFVKHS